MICFLFFFFLHTCQMMKNLGSKPMGYEVHHTHFFFQLFLLKDVSPLPFAFAFLEA